MKYRVIDCDGHFEVEYKESLYGLWKSAGYHANSVGNTFREYKFKTVEEAKKWIKEDKSFRRGEDSRIVYEE